MIGDNSEVFRKSSDDTFYSAFYDIVKLGPHVYGALGFKLRAYNEVTEADCKIVFIGCPDLKLMEGVRDVSAGSSRTKITMFNRIEFTVENVKIVEIRQSCEKEEKGRN